MKKQESQKKESWLIRGYGNVILFLSLVFILFLFWMAMISTSVISPDYNEHTYFTKSHIIWNVIILIFMIVILWKSRHSQRITQVFNRINTDDLLAKRIILILFLLLSGLLSWWILMLDAQPKADQQLVMETAKHMRFGDYVDFEKNGYVSMNHQQFGIVCTEYLLSFLFGTENYLACQLLNIPGLLFCYGMLVKILKETDADNVVCLATVILCFLFFPFSMYVIFVYGTVWGMAFALTSFYLAIRFFHHQNVKDLVFCGLSMTLSVFLKSNYQIFLIALILTALAESIRQKKGKILVLPLLVTGMLVGAFFFSETMIHSLAGDEYAQPMSTWTWIAMGTSENQTMADGWYSDAIGSDIYQISNGDAVIDEILTKDIVRKNLSIFQKHPDRLVRFLLKKTASQWNNPTFQGFWIVQRAPHAETSLTQDPFVHHVYQYLKVIQIMILIGVIFFILFIGIRKPEDLILLLTFAGGFLFHLFWEAKCQYTIVYFVLLIPYAAQGFYSLITAGHLKRNLFKNRYLLSLVMIVMLISLPLCIRNQKILQKDPWPELTDVQDPWGFTS